MIVQVYGKEGDRVIVSDTRYLTHGEYTVEVLTNNDGYLPVYSSTDMSKCIARAKQIEEDGLYDGKGLPIYFDRNIYNSR